MQPIISTTLLFRERWFVLTKFSRPRLIVVTWMPT